MLRVARVSPGGRGRRGRGPGASRGRGPGGLDADGHAAAAAGPAATLGTEGEIRKLDSGVKNHLEYGGISWKTGFIMIYPL